MEKQMYTVKQDGRPDLKFTGEMLADVSSREVVTFLPEKQLVKQKQIRIYKTDKTIKGKYVVSASTTFRPISESLLDHLLLILWNKLASPERRFLDQHRADLCDTRQDIVNSLSQGGELSPLAEKALEEASGEIQEQMPAQFSANWNMGITAVLLCLLGGCMIKPLLEDKTKEKN